MPTKVDVIFWGTTIVAILSIGSCTIVQANRAEADDPACYRNMPILYTYPEARPKVAEFMSDKFVSVGECLQARTMYNELRATRLRTEKTAEFDRVRKMVDGGRK
jgi:hypothetical protein